MEVGRIVASLICGFVRVLESCEADPRLFEPHAAQEETVTLVVRWPELQDL